MVIDHDQYFLDNFVQGESKRFVVKTTNTRCALLEAVDPQRVVGINNNNNNNLVSI